MNTTRTITDYRIFYRGSTFEQIVTGFGLLESGSVSAKDEVNIMVKNVVDVVFGGFLFSMLRVSVYPEIPFTLKFSWM